MKQLEKIVCDLEARVSSIKIVDRDRFLREFTEWIYSPEAPPPRSSKAWGKRLRRYYPEVGRKHIKKFLYNSVGLHYCSKCAELVPLDNSSGQARCGVCSDRWSKEYYQKNREYILTRHKEWATTNKDKVNFLNSLYRARRLSRTPTWVDYSKLREVYANCPDNMEVDHVIPLKGKLVSGLHVPENLQYLTREENAKKKNKYIVK